MDLISPDGIVLIGPGSEWFWSMLQFVVVVVTLVGIYYQLRLAGSANAFAQLDTLMGEWQSERMARKRLALLTAVRDGVSLDALPAHAAAAIGNYWEKVGGLVAAGHISEALITESFGAEVGFWHGLLTPWIARTKAIDPQDRVFAHFEALATRMGSGSIRGFDREQFDRNLDDYIASHEATIRDYEAMRSVIVVEDRGEPRPPGSTGATGATGAKRATAARASAPSHARTDVTTAG